MGESIGHVSRHVVRDVDASILTRQTAATIPGETESTVLSYTVSGGALILDAIAATGTFAAEFRLYVDGAWKETQRMGIEAPVATFLFPAGHRLEDGAVVEVKVFHYDTLANRDYEATLKAHR